MIKLINILSFNSIINSLIKLMPCVLMLYSAHMQAMHGKRVYTEVDVQQGDMLASVAKTQSVKQHPSVPSLREIVAKRIVSLQRSVQHNEQNIKSVLLATYFEKIEQSLKTVYSGRIERFWLSPCQHYCLCVNDTSKELEYVSLGELFSAQSSRLLSVPIQKKSLGEYAIRSLAFAQDGKRFLTVNSTGRVVLWVIADSSQGEEPKGFKVVLQKDGETCVAADNDAVHMSPKGNYALTSINNQFRFWNLTDVHKTFSINLTDHLFSNLHGASTQERGTSAQESRQDTHDQLRTLPYSCMLSDDAMHFALTFFSDVLYTVLYRIDDAKHLTSRIFHHECGSSDEDNRHLISRNWRYAITYQNDDLILEDLTTGQRIMIGKTSSTIRWAFSKDSSLFAWSSCNQPLCINYYNLNEWIQAQSESTPQQKVLTHLNPFNFQTNAFIYALSFDEDSASLYAKVSSPSSTYADLYTINLSDGSYQRVPVSTFLCDGVSRTESNTDVSLSEKSSSTDIQPDTELTSAENSNASSSSSDVSTFTFQTDTRRTVLLASLCGWDGKNTVHLQNRSLLYFSKNSQAYYRSLKKYENIELANEGLLALDDEKRLILFKNPFRWLERASLSELIALIQ